MQNLLNVRLIIENYLSSSSSSSFQLVFEKYNQYHQNAISRLSHHSLIRTLVSSNSSSSCSKHILLRWIWWIRINICLSSSSSSSSSSSWSMVLTMDMSLSRSWLQINNSELVRNTQAGILILMKSMLINWIDRIHMVR